MWKGGDNRRLHKCGASVRFTPWCLGYFYGYIAPNSAVWSLMSCQVRLCGQGREASGREGVVLLGVHRTALMSSRASLETACRVDGSGASYDDAGCGSFCVNEPCDGHHCWALSSFLSARER